MNQSSALKSAFVDLDTLLSRQEGYDCDFKREPKGLSSEDLVAFANSAMGGTILIGVAESKGPTGTQEVQIVGCKVGDAERMTILDKAEKCIPPVDIQMNTVSRQGYDFLRIDIPSSPRRPHCTAGGTYKIRGDARNLALEPGRLLGLFIQVESARFVSRFREAASHLEAALGGANEVGERMIEHLTASIISLLEVQNDRADLVQRSLEDLRQQQMQMLERFESNVRQLEISAQYSEARSRESSDRMAITMHTLLDEMSSLRASLQNRASEERN